MRRRADLVPLIAGWEICVGWTPISCAGNAKIWVVLPIGANLRQNFFVGHNPSSDGDRQALTGISNFPEADFWPGIASGLPVTRGQRGSVELVRSSNECIGDFESTVFESATKRSVVQISDSRPVHFASIRRLPN